MVTLEKAVSIRAPEPAHDSRLETRRAPKSLRAVKACVDACTSCPLYANATQGVAGEGPAKPKLMLVGEQPGDQEDLAGKPFVGPAGKLLDRALADAGRARAETYITNAVKHFKHEQRGKRRLHKRPNTYEIERCRWWLSQEIRLTKPKLIVALGASAVRSVLGHAATLKTIRGQKLTSAEGVPAFASVHPSMLLRLPEHEDREREFKAFGSDLKKAAKLANG